MERNGLPRYSRFVFGLDCVKYVNFGNLVQDGDTKAEGSFSRFGVPDELYTDNGPQYSSWEFKQFSKEWGFIHKTSSPGFLKVMVLSKEQFKQPTECLTSASVMELILI